MNTQRYRHPERERLTAFAVGNLSDVESDQIESHLSECSECLEIVELAPNDTLVALLQSQETTPDSQSQIVRNSGVYEITQTSHDDVQAEATVVLAAAQQPGEIGRLGSYRVLKEIGRGGMGIVFLGEDIQLGRQVVIKVMKPGISAGVSANERFLREARANACLDHDNIVPVHHVGEEGGMPFIVMPLLKGQSLADLLQRSESISVSQIIRIGLQTARGLAAAHTRGLIHRDIQPGNLWIEMAGPWRPHDLTFRVKILDFGLARPVLEDSKLTQDGVIVGTPAYMGPEQAAGSTVDHRSDLFSLGCVLYHLCVGRPPFEGKNILDTLRNLGSNTPKPFDPQDSSVPKPLSDLIMQLLENNPQDRPATTEEVVTAFERLEEQYQQTTTAGGDVELASLAQQSDHVDRLNGATPESISGSQRGDGDSNRNPLFRFWRSWWGRVAVLVGILGIVTIIFQSQAGTVTITIEGDGAEDVEVELQGNGVVQIANRENNWTVKLPEDGVYSVTITQGQNLFKIDRENVKVEHGQHVQIPATRVSQEPSPLPQLPLLQIDDGDDGYVETSTPGKRGWGQGKLTENAWQGDYRYNDDGSRTAKWTFTGLKSGVYEAFITWTPRENWSNEAFYTVSDGGEKKQEKIVNQRNAPKYRFIGGHPWERIAIIETNTGTLVIELDATKSRNGGVVADGAQIFKRIDGTQAEGSAARTDQSLPHEKGQ